MNRLDECFRKLKDERRKALMPYLTAGDPDLDVSLDLAVACEQGGADLLELGIPFRITWRTARRQRPYKDP